MAKRRPSGDGMVRKREDGRWEGRYTAGYDPKTGKRLTKNVLGRTQAEVKEKLRKALEDCQQLDMTRVNTYTVESWIKIWYEVYAEPRLREKTKDYYLNYIDNHIIPCLGKTKLEELTTIQIQMFYNDLQKNGRVQRYKHIKLKDTGLSTRVVRGIHTLLNNCLEQAVAERLILINPAKGCKLPKIEKKEMKILPQEKIGPYLAEAERRGLLAAYYLELTTGLRRGELAGAPLDGPGCGEQDHLCDETGEPHQGRAGGEPAENTELCADAGDPVAGGRPSGGGTQEAPRKSVYVPVAQDGDDVRPGFLPTHP